MTQLPTEIARVTVFRDGARVTRTGKTKLGPGPHKIVVPEITSLAREDSFRVKGKGPASLSTIDVRRVEKVFEPEEDIKGLYDEWKALEKQQRAIQDEIDIYNSRLGHMNSMMGEFVGMFGQAFAAEEVKIQQLTEMDSKTVKITEDTHEKIRQLQEKDEEISTKIDVIRKNLGEIASKKRSVVTFEVDISLEVRQEAEIELEVTYQTRGANWVPSYDVDLLVGKAKIRRVAMVSNQTHENWKEVGLTISTATAKPVEAIQGTPFYVSEYIPRPVMRGEGRKMKKMAYERSAPKPAMAPAPGGAGMGGYAPPPPEIIEEFAEASESSSGIAIYELPKPVTIPFDYEKHPITLTEEELETRTIHYWYTDAMAEVVAQDEVTNGDNVILPGKVKVYAQGDYIGETTINQISPREKFKLGTRVAYDVKAKKQLVEKEIEKAGITRGKLRRSYRYRLEIESFSKQEVEIEIIDRVPHSNSTSIEVKIDWEKLGLKKQELGVMEWTKKIAPSQKIEILYDYEVYWEKGVTITPPLP
ncbi:MAG: mucoidy inhibitor MuiA family protein [Candidatus Thorarchaeota archaeon]